MRYLDPESIALATPTYDGKLSALCVQGLIEVVANRGLAMHYFQTGCSNIQLARNRCVHWFLAGPWEHLVFLDADIGFRYSDWLMLLEDDGADAACAYYRKKDQRQAVKVHLGLGFARISRRVFQAMAELRTEDGRDLMPRFRMDGEEWIDFFPQGIGPDGTWRGEDHAFWLCAKIAGAAVRVEDRCRLIHTGEAHWVFRREDFADESSAYGTSAEATSDGLLAPPADAYPEAI